MITMPSRVLVIVKKTVWVVVWVFIFYFINRAIFPNYDPDSDIRIFTTDDGISIGAKSIIGIIISAVLTRFLYMGVLFYKAKHFGILSNDDAIDRDKLIYDLQRDIDLNTQIEKKLKGTVKESRISNYSSKINRIVELVRKRHLYKEEQLGLEGADEERIKKETEDHTTWHSLRDYYIESGLKEKILEVTTQNVIDTPGEYEIETIYDSSAGSYGSPKVESGLSVSHRSGSSFTIRVTHNGIMLKMAIAGNDNEYILIKPEKVSIKDVHRWLKRITERK